MSDAAIFPWLDNVLKDGDAGAAFEQLAGRFRRDKQYRALFDVRLMEARHELDLPLVSAPAINDLPAELQSRYQDASVRAAREVGELVLADGNIPQAWPYFRAIGDTVPVVEASTRSTCLMRKLQRYRRRSGRRSRSRSRKDCTRERASS